MTFEPNSQSARMEEQDQELVLEQDDYVCSQCSCTSSSSGESLTDDIDVKQIFIEEDGKSEMILVPRREIREDESSNSPPQHLNEEVLGGLGYSGFFLACVSSLKQELIRRSPRGQRLGVMLDAIGNLEQEKITDFAISIIARVNSCLVAGNKHKLPSVAQASVWSTFHQLRGNHEVKKIWNTFISTNISELHQKEPQLALQLLSDRLLKQLLKNKAQAMKDIKSSVASSVQPLTSLESNAIRYMAGYVAVTLLKRYKKHSRHPQLQLKYDMFVRVLTGMKAEDQPGIPVSFLDYTKLWSELIDRGGLYHIDDKVFHLIESIELLVRRHLSIHRVQEFTPDTNIRACILEDVEKSESILSCWEEIAHTIHAKYELYSVELLRVVTNLWITIRGHSFAKEWTMMFERKCKKGTRKTLLQ